MSNKCESALADDANSVDGEGVWSPDIEDSFQKALAEYPACGRRKHILQDGQDGGKMYGRNELIARYIFLDTGKKRTRKQVSSHIQVLARRKAKMELNGHSSATPSPSSNHIRTQLDQPPPQPQPQPPLPALPPTINHTLNHSAQTNGKRHVVNQHLNNTNHHLNNHQLGYYDLWHDRQIVTQKIRLVEFSAFIEHRNLTSETPISSSAGFARHPYVQIDYTQPTARHFYRTERIDISQIEDKFLGIGGPDGLFQRGPSDAFFVVKFWADINKFIDDQNSYFGFSSHFETIDAYKDITCSTKAYSYGKLVVEKNDKMYAKFNDLNGRYTYDINRSPMCEFMINFIKKLRQLPNEHMMNSVLENFTVLQVITSESTSEILLCLAYVFEVVSTDQNNGPHYHVYQLT